MVVERPFVISSLLRSYTGSLSSRSAALGLLEGLALCLGVTSFGSMLGSAGGGAVGVKVVSPSLSSLSQVSTP